MIAIYQETQRNLEDAHRYFYEAITLKQRFSFIDVKHVDKY